MIECHSNASKSPRHDYVIHELKRTSLWRISKQLLLPEKAVPGRIFGMRDLLYLKAGVRDLKVKWARFGIESMHEMRDAENNHRDYGIERKFWSG